MCGTTALAQDATPTPEPTATPTPTATPDPIAQICPRIVNVKAPILYKAEASPHIGDPRMSKSTTLIFGRRWKTSPVDCIHGYNQNGRLIHKLGVYARNEYAYKARYYGGWGCGDAKTPAKIRQLADRGPLYLKISKSSCLRLSNKGIMGRVGSIY